MLMVITFKNMMKTLYFVACGMYKNLKNQEYQIFKKTLVLSIICSNFKNEDEKIFKDE